MEYDSNDDALYILVRIFELIAEADAALALMLSYLCAKQLQLKK